MPVAQDIDAERIDQGKKSFRIPFGVVGAQEQKGSVQVVFDVGELDAEQGGEHLVVEAFVVVEVGQVVVIGVFPAVGR